MSSLLLDNMFDRHCVLVSRVWFCDDHHTDFFLYSFLRGRVELTPALLNSNQNNGANLSTPPRSEAGGSNAADASIVTPLFSPEMLQSMVASAVAQALMTQAPTQTSPPVKLVEEVRPVDESADTDPTFEAMLNAKGLAPTQDEEVVFQGVKPAALVAPPPTQAAQSQITLGDLLQRLQAMQSRGVSSTTPIDLAALGLVGRSNYRCHQGVLR